MIDATSDHHSYEATEAVAKKAQKKIEWLSMGFEPMTSTIQVQ